MVVKNMVQEINCAQCENNRNCSEVYQKMGQCDSSPVLLRVLLAFLLPLLTFIVVLVFNQKFWIEGANSRHGLQGIKPVYLSAASTLISFLIAAVSAVIISVLARRIAKHFGIIDDSVKI